MTLDTALPPRALGHGSLAEAWALLPEDERNEALSKFSDSDLAAIKYDWAWWAGPKQMPPPGQWTVWLLLAGRGYGKTRTGAEHIRWQVEHGGKRSIALVAPTAADVRKVIVEGPSGLLSICPPGNRPLYEPSKTRLVWPNGAVAHLYSADEPDRLRGPEHDYAWCVAAGVPVVTRRGQIPIEQVQVKDQVWTRLGWKPVKAAKQTGVQRTVMDIDTDCGTLRCTPDHRVWVEGQGWVQAVTIQPGAILQACLPMDPRLGLTTREFVGTTVTAPGGTEIALAPRSPKPFGVVSTDQSRMDLKSTTEMGTRLTTPQRTLSWLVDGSIGRTTGLRTVARRAVGRKAPKQCGLSGSRSRTPVGGVRQPSSVVPRMSTTVPLPTGRPTRVRSVWKHSGYANVYDLEVEGAHEFYAGGVLVHNCDELAAWRYAERAFGIEGLQGGLRAGSDPRVVVTTTPRPTPIIKGLLKDSNCVVTRGTSYENLANLAATFISQVIKKFEGTRLGRQELLAEILDDILGALWTLSLIDQMRIPLDPNPQAPPPFELDFFTRIVVAVDPPIKSAQEAAQIQEIEDVAEAGIIVAGLGRDGHAYILEDASLQAPPLRWANVACQMYNHYRADCLVAEINQGGEMVEATIHTADPRVPVKTIQASRGKLVRAEPVSALAEQGKVHHVGAFPKLEDQMVTWVPGLKSPDRMDAMVYAITELMLGPASAPAFVM